ncbi:hypothetical protein F5887DRAFT_123620 [Amanita rubescens]|nr:hypothetical protein F5887DRAFT_123620 [Amanita rubescens]
MMARPKKRQKSKAKHSVFRINQFPREILAEIFWFCLPEKHFEPRKGPVRMLKRAAPFLVSSICSSWRELALATPKLWTTVGITLGNPDKDLSTTVHVVDNWLERSGTLPLKLYLAQMSSVYDVPLSRSTDVAHSQPILSAFYSHSSRWQDVSLSLYETRLLSPPRLDTPLLRSFRLSGPWQEASHFPFRNSSRLTELSWPSPIDVSENPHIPWSQISHLNFSHGMSQLSVFSVLEIIQSCPRLEDFKVGCPDEVANLPRELKVENGRLRKLELNVYGDISLLLLSLTLPALEHFTYSTLSDEDVIPTTLHESLLDFLTRSKCKLEKLELRYCKFSADEFLECLEHEASKTIQKLCIIEWPRFTDDVLLRLTYPPFPSAPRILLPKLKHLALESCVDASPSILGEMVSSRYYPGTVEAEQLEVLVLLVEEDLDEEDEAIIEDLVADGLELDTRTFVPELSNDFIE